MMPVHQTQQRQYKKRMPPVPRPWSACAGRPMRRGCCSVLWRRLPCLFFIVFFWHVFAASAFSAELRWEALPDRERITILLREVEGMAGPLGRIAPTGILAPFTEVPPGLVLDETPKGARLFKSTRQQGRALVILTQTPQFGFLVAKQSAREVVIDLFPNELGARWKPSGKAPTTEKAPDLGVPPPSSPDASSQALLEDPEGKGASSAELLRAGRERDKEEAAETASSGPAPEGQPTAGSEPGAAAPMRETAAEAAPSGQGQSSSEAPASASASIPGANSSASSPPVLAPPSPPKTERVQTAPAKGPVVVLSGSPEHAATVTRQAETPAPSSDPAAPRRAGDAFTAPLPAQGTEEPRAASMEKNLSSKPFFDNRALTAERSAPLPVPAPPALSTDASARDESSSSGISGQIPIQTPLPEPEENRRDLGVKPGPGVGLLHKKGVYGGEIHRGDLGQIPSPAPASGSRRDEHAQPAEAQDPQKASSGGSAAPEHGPATAGMNKTALAGNSTDPRFQEGAIPWAAPEGEKGAAKPAAPEKGKSAAPAPSSSAAPASVKPGQGDPGAPPVLDPVSAIQEIRNLANKGQLEQAIAGADMALANAPLNAEQREELLHIKSEIMFAAYKGTLAERYRDIADATSQALNFNAKSPRNAAALLRLGYMNLKLKNLPEAEARFNLLRRLYPDDENVPLTYYYWGDYYFGRNEMQKAADEFQLILQKYPNSRYAREAALGLARAFYRMGYYDRAFNIVDYVERRWERFYIEYPPFLNMMGDVAFRLNKYDYALRQYWLYVNLEPNGEEVDIILTRIGDIYSAQREKNAAKELYKESIRRFPDKDGALVAMMRLAEEGVYDSPSIAGMFSVFDGSFNLQAQEVYTRIIQDHPQSMLVPLAKIKLAMWFLHQHEYTKTLDTIGDFLEKYPKHELAPKAKEIALQTFAVLGTESVTQGNYGRMREIWEKYPIVHSQGEILSPESRIALGVSYWKEGKPNEALEAVGTFFLGSKVPEYSEMALSLVLSIYLEYDQWQAIQEVAKRVELWELKPENQQQLDYALALAAENMGQSEKAAQLWQKLYDSNKLPPAQMAYAVFFLARYAEKDRELERAYFLGSEALKRLMEQAQTNATAADAGKIKSQLASLMDVAETAGRLRESLGFAEQYLQYLPAGDAERMAVRYRMARIYRKQGNLDKWKELLTELVRENPNSVYGQIAASELKTASIAKDAEQYSPTGRL